MKEDARKKEYREKKRASSSPTGLCTAFDDEKPFGEESDDEL